MIYLIGGAPRCGKTILSKKIASKKRISFVSVDVLRPMIMASFSASERKKRFPSEYVTTPPGKFRFEVQDSKKAIRIANKESQTTWPPIKAFIEKLIEREESYVIEGANLMPKYLHRLTSSKFGKHIRVIYLVKTDLEKIKTGFAKTSGDVYDWMYPHIQGDDQRVTAAAQYVQGYGRYLEREANKHHFDVIHTDQAFRSALKHAEQLLLSTS